IDSPPPLVLDTFGAAATGPTTPRARSPASGRTMSLRIESPLFTWRVDPSAGPIPFGEVTRGTGRCVIPGRVGDSTRPCGHGRLVARVLLVCAELGRTAPAPGSGCA